MTTSYTNTTFLSKYKDDFDKTDKYHRILFNSARAVQARELTQLQTIIQEELGRFGRNIFKEGAAVNPGGLTVNNAYEFVKIESATPFPTSTTPLIGSEFTGGTSGIKVKVLEAVGSTTTDPDTLYVSYTDTSSGTSSAVPIRLTPGESISDGTYTFTVQLTNTVSDPAVGLGTRASIGEGDFFSQGHFVYAPAQSKVISKYTSTPNEDIGFKVVQDIVSTSDNSALYDNQGASPNLSAPGADRYRINLNIAIRSELDSADTFVYMGKVKSGSLVDEVNGLSDYNKINDLLAVRTKEESGNYNVAPFIIKFEEHDSDTTKLYLKISEGISYVNGYRAAIDYPSKIVVDKAQDTVLLNNEVAAANYGNYVIGTGGYGARNINTFPAINLRDSIGYLGATIGSARVRFVEADNANYKYSLFDIKMNSGKSFRNTKSIGTTTTDYFDIVQENGKAVLKKTADNSLLFELPNDRPSVISDISLTVQRRFTTTTDGSGNATITLTASGETFADTNNWFMSDAASANDSGASVSGAGTTTGTITGGAISSSNYEILAYVNKAAATVRAKTLTETTVTTTMGTDSNGNQYIDLGVPDIYSVSRMRNTDSNGTDVINKFTLDNGQRDNMYDLGKMLLNGGQTAPSGNVFVRFKYFTHGTGDFFAVNSYTGQVNYADIPNHRKDDGTVVSLRDVLDFRPAKNSSGAFNIIQELPKDTDLITTDVTYYQSKYSKLVIDTSSNLSVISGPSSLNPIIPPVPSNALELYTIKLNPFTLNDSDMTVEKIDNKRYTMADITRLENRLEDLEEVTALSLLELDTNNFDVLDSTGANRAKSGFMVDNFKDHFFSDTLNSEYKASIDPNSRVLRPGFWATDTKLVYDSSLSTNTILKGDNVYLKYNHVSQINQSLATATENINPFAVITNTGTIQLSPGSDNWSEQRGRSAQTVNNTGARIVNSLERNWNNWEWNWAGTSGNNNAEIVRSNTRSTTQTSRSSNVTPFGSIISRFRNRTVNANLIPFMRSRKVYFKAEGLKPNTKMFPFFDGVRVDAWCREEAFTRTSSDPTDYGNTYINATSHPDTSSALISDAEGRITGSFFIPNTTALKFRTGSREFKLLDISADDNTSATSIARVIFSSRGTFDNTVSTRPQTGGSSRNAILGLGLLLFLIDPLAQSFYVDDTNGMFLTKVDLFFSSKDATVPVELQIRPMVNGSPSSSLVVPGGSKYLSPASVNTSTDGTQATTFEFDEPIYLQPFTEYALVIKAESTDYNVFVAQAGDFLIGSTQKRVTKQPTLGSLFKSQNGTTWEPDQTKDLTFNLYRADFISTTGSAILENGPIPRRVLDNNPITVDSGSATVTVSHPNHGLMINDITRITGIDSATTIGGIKATSILGNRTILAKDLTGYTFTADSSGTSNEIGGGNNVMADQNFEFDLHIPAIESLLPNSTSIALSGKLTTSKSYAGTETAYAKDATYSDLYMNENNVLSAPHMIANTVNETAQLGGSKSATLKIDYTTTNSNVSPIVDMQRSSMHLIGNVIDKQDSAATVGFNVPLNFVNETDHAYGSIGSKHLTKPVTLEEDAVGLKILIGANRPSVADFEVYYRTGADETVLSDIAWTKVTEESTMPSDDNPTIFRDYTYLVGGQGGTLTPFVKFQIKIVFRTTNSSKVPVIKDLRVIALGV